MRTKPEETATEDAFMGYVPVISAAYERLFEELPDKLNCYVLGQPVIDQFPNLRKEIRALPPERAAAYLEVSGFFGQVAVVGSLEELEIAETTIHIPEDEISEAITAALPDKMINRHAVFLRWSRENTVVNVDITPDRVVQADDFQVEVVRLLHHEAGQATNWWRGVGAAIVANGQIVDSAHNFNMPSDYTSAIDGDPRSSLKRGVGIEITNDTHAEAALIARAARHGNSTDGAEIYVDTFPCPKCAKDIVNAGIKRCYYLQGYAVTDAFDILKSADIELIKLETELQPELSDKVRLLDYPENS